jgi:hypothetical protein
MAEGGEKNEDNPFSFKKFVSPRDKENETTEESEHTMANGQVLDILPDIGFRNTLSLQKVLQGTVHLITQQGDSVKRNIVERRKLFYYLKFFC